MIAEFAAANRGGWSVRRSMDLRHSKSSRHWRSGFTIVELIVVIAIISILMSLLLPAVQQARSAARRTQCQNNMRNVDLALLQVADVMGRFPACGNFGRDVTTGQGLNFHSWVVDALPWIDRNDLANKWNKDLPISDSSNVALAATFIAALTCPSDITLTGQGDLSFAVNGGVGFTAQIGGVDDCPVDPNGSKLDMNGNAVTCPAIPKADGSPSDKDYFFETGLFFNETWKWNVTVRHHRIDDVLDGMSQTIVLTENVRTGVDPTRPGTNWASNNPYLTSFYVGNPCLNAKCAAGNVDYSLSNSGRSAINSGLSAPEGSSPRPNSYHPGGAHFGFGDGHVKFVSQNINGKVYAALCSPQGTRLTGTPLAQGAVGDDY